MIDPTTAWMGRGCRFAAEVLLIGLRVHSTSDTWTGEQPALAARRPACVEPIRTDSLRGGGRADACGTDPAITVPEDPQVHPELVMMAWNDAATLGSRVHVAAGAEAG